MAYVANTRNQGIEYRRCNFTAVDVYSDSDFANDRDNRKSRSGHAAMIAFKLISWSSKLQEIVTLSSTEAEYVAATEAAKEAMWIKNWLKEIGLTPQIVLHVDNTSAISLIENPVNHKRSKHIEVRFHKLREWYNNGDLKIEHTRSDLMVADIFTKNVSANTMKKMKNLLNISDNGI